MQKPGREMNDQDIFQDKIRTAYHPWKKSNALPVILSTH